MSKIVLNNTQYNIIDDCCKKLYVKDDYKSNTTLYDSLTELKYSCEELQYKLNALQDAVIDIDLAISDHDTEKLVQTLKEMTDLTCDFSREAKDINKAMTDAVMSFKSNSENLPFTLFTAKRKSKN